MTRTGLAQQFDTRRATRPTPRARARGRHLRVVRARRAPNVPFYIGSFVIVGALVVSIVSAQAMVSQGSFHLQELTRRTRALEEAYGELKLEAARLSSPGRIATEARDLGLRLPEEVNILYVKMPAEESRGRPGPQRPAFALKGLLGEQP